VFNENPSHNDVWRNWGIAPRTLNLDTIAVYFSASRSGRFKPCEKAPEQEAALALQLPFPADEEKWLPCCESKPSSAGHIYSLF